MTSVTGSRGFTLLELMVVLLIIVLMVAAWPFAASRVFPAQQLRTETARLAATLRQARAAARASGNVARVNVSSHGYAFNGESRQLPDRIGLALQQTERATPDIVFFPDGSSSGGTLLLTLSQRQSRINIGEVTGRLETVL